MYSMTTKTPSNDMFWANLLLDVNNREKPVYRAAVNPRNVLKFTASKLAVDCNFMARLPPKMHAKLSVVTVNLLRFNHRKCTIFRAAVNSRKHYKLTALNLACKVYFSDTCFL